MSLLEKLAVKHPYYCSESNYYSNDGAMHFATMTDFLDGFEPRDVDMNLCFRWDVKLRSERYGDDEKGYCAEVFLMLQRKGIFRSCSIDRIDEQEAERFLAYATKHLETIKAIWSPLL